MLARPLVVLSSAVLAAAVPWPSETPTVTVTVTAPAPTNSASSCTTGNLQCCQTTATASPGVSFLLGLLGITISDVKDLIGLNCSPISVVLLGQGECSAHTVCCQNNNAGGLISIGCVPVFL